jgi:hypothetical protein
MAQELRQVPGMTVERASALKDFASRPFFPQNLVKHKHAL